MILFLVIPLVLTGVTPFVWTLFPATDDCDNNDDAH